MFIFRYIKTLINIYLLYIQPILGMFLIGIGLWGFYAPDGELVLISILSYALYQLLMF